MTEEVQPLNVQEKEPDLEQSKGENLKQQILGYLGVLTVSASAIGVIFI